ncbi:MULTISPECIES: TetR/AcrR family transcriptional regulator [unclassified Curtobacterium]|uniref:TetR/AcrR family transcriptional regulator n=1 Tax=unclassified Curtobacterium TaxID=257496 RepID=UPI00082484A6|nr:MULTISPECIES: TetR/AcrR family transcriptional regulator [unclassified Curtobacterium]WIA95995.1 TetR/AcrR family transcriptional regulator [Curtobacterium sp. MCBA15_004]WIA99297.1 TetR/AcrR family transcriptional regulator [Curtobacterium sp. MCBA15_012]
MDDLQATPVDDGVLADRVVRSAIRAYRLYPFDQVDTAAVADTCGVTVEDVRRVFPSWDALLLVTYDRWVQLRGTGRSQPAACTVDHVRRSLAEDVADPGLVRLLAGVVNLASSECDFGELFRARFDEYVGEVAHGLEFDVVRGIEQLGIPAHQAATQLIAVYQGLQVQMLVRPYLDVLVEFDRMIRTVRAGWREQEPAPWDLDAAPVLG